VTVIAGATQPVCGPLTDVPAGTFTITEGAAAGTVLVGVRTVGTGSVTLAGRTATVTVPEGNAAQQTQVIFRNSAG
jgi:hypothetical protein